MRVVALLLALAAAAQAEEARAFVELTTQQDDYYVGQSVRITLLIGYDAAFFEKQAVQLYQRRLEVPIHVDAEGFEGLGASDGKTIALNDDVIVASVAKTVLRGERAYATLTVERTLLLEAPGDISIPAPVLRFVSGTKFREDFLRGRVALDRRATTVTGKPLAIRALPIPETGRPDDWHGAIGRFTIRTAVSTQELDEGQHFDLTLHIEGEGNLRTMPLPRLADLGLVGFHVYGSLDEPGDDARTIQYDLAPLSGDLDAVPALALSYFDPTSPAGFRVAHSEAIPITVRTTADESYVEAYVIPGWGIAVSVIAVIALLAIALVLWRATRRTEAGPSAALLQFEAQAASSLSDAFSDYLAAHLGCARAAVISPELKSRLVAANVPEELAARTAALVESLVGARYGGGATDNDVAQEAHELVAALESVFPPRRT